MPRNKKQKKQQWIKDNIDSKFDFLEDIPAEAGSPSKSTLEQEKQLLESKMND